MKNAKILLDWAADIVPPDIEQLHTITLNENGGLVLTFFMGSICRPVILEDTDLNKPINQLISEIELEITAAINGTKRKGQ